MGEIFSVSRQKTQESLLTSTNMLKQLEVEESGETRKKSVIHLRNGDPNVPLDAA